MPSTTSMNRCSTAHKRNLRVDRRTTSRIRPNFWPTLGYMITVDFTSPDLLEQDRRELVEMVAKTNYRLEVGDLRPLMMTVETFQSPTYRESKSTEHQQFQHEIEAARDAGEVDVVVALEAVMKSRAARTAIVDDLATQLWDLLT